MEQFVKALYDRLESSPDLQMQLFTIMQKAIDEMHNNGIIAGLSGEIADRMHDPNPEVRVTEKTLLAKSVGKQFIPTTAPKPSKAGLSYLANVNYDPRFANSITLCLQGGIEGLHMAFANNQKLKLDKYIIQIVNGSTDLSALRNNVEQLDKMYDDVSIVLMFDGKTIYPMEGNSKEKSGKKGLFGKIFGKK